MSDAHAASRDPLRHVAALVDDFHRTRDRHPLDAAAEVCRSALRTARVGSREHTAYLGGLRNVLVMRWSAFSDRADLDESIVAGRELARGAAPYEQDLRLLGRMLADRHDLDGDRADLHEAITALRRSADMPPDGNWDHRPSSLDSLGSLLLSRAELTGSESDMAQAERLQRRALSLLAEGAEELPAVRNNLASTLRRVFEATGDPAAAEEAVDLLRAAVAALPPGAPHREQALLNLASVWQTKAELSGDAADMAEMVRAARAALAAVPRTHPRHGQALTGLGVALRLAAENSESTDGTQDVQGAGLLRESVTLLREAVRGTPRESDAYPNRLNSLGNALHRLGERTGDATLLDEAIGALREAVAASPPHGPGRFRCLANLAVTLRERYHQTGDLEALREAAGLAREALRTPAPPHESAGHLANLGVVLQTWFDRTGDPAAVTEAVDAARRVLAGTPAGGTEHAVRTNHLANALHQRYESRGDPADLDEAVALLSNAVDETPYGDPLHAGFLHNLGLALLTGARAAEDLELLNQAVIALGRAVWAPSEGEAAAANHLRSYASALRTLHEATGDPAVLLAAEDAYRQVALIGSLPAANRIRAAGAWGTAAADAERWEEALKGFELALELLPFTITRRLARSDQEYGLTSVQGLAADAAACAVNAGRPDLAVLLLEQGRGVLLGQTIAARGEVERLRAAYPDAAERFERLRDRIDALDAAAVEDGTAGRTGDANGAADDAASRDGGAVDGRNGSAAGGAGAAGGEGGAAPDLGGLATAGVPDERHALAARWERLVTEIRALPGFAGFLAAPAWADVLACADRGPVVVAYCSAYRSDALVIRPDGVLTVPLPLATPEAVETQVARFDAALTAATEPAGEHGAQEALGEVLAWTWESVARPVLERLGLLTPPAGGAWPHVWWSAGGALAALPLHAAGHHQERPGPEPRTVLDCVVSSYTPTVRALAYARARAAGGPPAGRLLAVVLPDAPGTRPLGGVRREVRELEALLPAEIVAGPAATFAAVVRALPAHPYVHFACHGVSDPDDPSSARLLVHDHQEHPLTVRHVSRLHLPDARLAVLSACETARGSVGLADESIHITSAFQIAGYPHAIGTLWSVHDAVAVRVTRSLYRALREGHDTGSPGLSTERTADALHRAVRECRDVFRASPSLWAAHVHSGA